MVRVRSRDRLGRRREHPTRVHRLKSFGQGDEGLESRGRHTVLLVGDPSAVDDPAGGSVNGGENRRHLGGCPSVAHLLPDQRVLERKNQRRSAFTTSPARDHSPAKCAELERPPSPNWSVVHTRRPRRQVRTLSPPGGPLPHSQPRISRGNSSSASPCSCPSGPPMPPTTRGRWSSLLKGLCADFCDVSCIVRGKCALRRQARPRGRKAPPGARPHVPGQLLLPAG